MHSLAESFFTQDVVDCIHNVNPDETTFQTLCKVPQMVFDMHVYYYNNSHVATMHACYYIGYKHMYSYMCS